MTISRREFLAGMAVVFTVPAVLRDPELLDFQRWESEMPPGIAVKGPPLKVGLLNEGAEVSGAGYARQPASFVTAVDGVLTNDLPIEWPTFTGVLTVDEMALYDEHDNQLMRGALTSRYHLMPGDTLMFNHGMIAVTLA